MILTFLISFIFINPALGSSNKNVTPKIFSTIKLSKNSSLLNQTGRTKAQTSNAIPSGITESSLLDQTNPQIFKEKLADDPTDKQTFIDEQEFLENFFNTHKAVDIHNKALILLNNDQKNQALLLLKRNLYQNLFFPSYLVLFHMKIPVFFSPFLWQISLFVLALIGLVSLYWSIKKDFKARLLLFFLVGIFILLVSQFIFLKKRVSSLQEIKLHSSPFLEAPVRTVHPPNLDLVVLKERGEWLRLRANGKQTGWVLKKKIFPIF